MSSVWKESLFEEYRTNWIQDESAQCYCVVGMFAMYSMCIEGRAMTYWEHEIVFKTMNHQIYSEDVNITSNGNAPHILSGRRKLWCGFLIISCLKKYKI